jgi:hypothetical protein
MSRHLEVSGARARGAKPGAHAPAKQRQSQLPFRPQITAIAFG